MTFQMSPWCRAVKIALLDSGITQREIARRLGIYESKVSGIIRGTVIDGECIDAISELLKIEVPYSFPSISENSNGED